MSGHNLRANCHQRTLAPPFNSGLIAAIVSVQALPVRCHYSAGTDIGRGSIETTGNIVLTSGVPCVMNGVTLSYCYYLQTITMVIAQNRNGTDFFSWN